MREERAGAASTKTIFASLDLMSPEIVNQRSFGQFRD
jgi:hypothetical protein